MRRWPPGIAPLAAVPAAVQGRAAGGEGDAQQTLAARAIGAAVQDDDAVLRKQVLPHGVGRESGRAQIAQQLPQIDHHKQTAVGDQRIGCRECLEAAGRPGRGGPDTRRPSAGRSPGSTRSAQAAASCTNVAGPRLNCCSTSSMARDQLGRGGTVADAPAGHGIGLREAVDQHRPRCCLGQRRRRDVPPAVVDQRFVDLVADQQQVVLDDEIDDRLQLLRREDRADGVPGMVQQQARGFAASGRLRGPRARS